MIVASPPPWIERHWPHALTKVATGVACTAGLRVVMTAPGWQRAILCSVGTVAIGKAIACAKYCGRPAAEWPWSVALKDTAADLWATSLVSLPLTTPKGWRLGIVGSLVYLGGLHRWAKP